MAGAEERKKKTGNSKGVGCFKYEHYSKHCIGGSGLFLRRIEIFWFSSAAKQKDAFFFIFNFFFSLSVVESIF